jgi:hypothetical protein
MTSLPITGPTQLDESQLRRDGARSGLLVLSILGAAVLWLVDLAPGALALLVLVAALGSPVLTLGLMVIAYQLQGWALAGLDVGGMVILPTDMLTVMLAAQFVMGVVFKQARRLALLIPVGAFFLTLALSFLISTASLSSTNIESSTPFARFFLTNLMVYLAFMLIDKRQVAQLVALGVRSHAVQVIVCVAAILIFAVLGFDLTASINEGVEDNAGARLIFTATETAFRVMGTYGDPNLLSEMLILTLVCAAILGSVSGQRLTGSRLVGLFALGVVLAQARTGLLGLFVVFGVWLTLTSSRSYRFLLGAAFLFSLMVLIGLFGIIEQRLTDPIGLMLRQQGWNFALQRYADGGPATWLFGIGFGRYSWLATEIFGAQTYAEMSILNTYLIMLVETGVFGLLAFVTLLLAPLALVRQLGSAIPREARVLVLAFVAGFAAISIFDATLFAASPVTTMFCISLGALDRVITAASATGDPVIQTVAQ